MKHSDYITHVKNEEDIPFLKSTLFHVNMRLFGTSKEYREIVLKCCEYIRMLALTQTEEYKKPHGMSGANVAIPFNIIGVVRRRGTSNEWCEIMINPVITEYYGDIVDSLSNCGSLTLKDPISIKRREFCRVKWYNEKGRLCNLAFAREGEGFTIQHEVDHNLGILITDRV